MTQQEKEKMFLDLNSVLVKFWKEQGRPEKEIKIELLERMLNWYKKMGYVTLDKQGKEPVSKDLQEAARLYAEGPECTWVGTTALEVAFKDGAKWEAEQFEKNRISACDALTKEEYDREVAFSTEIIEKEHRQPTFTDAINYGMQYAREQMLKEAVEGVVYRYESYQRIATAIVVDIPREGLGNKVKIIIVKEE